MIGHNELATAKALAKQYPDIFSDNTEAAASYLTILENIKAIHDELSQTDSVGKKHSQTVIDFLNTNIQFYSRDNLFLVTEDIISFANVCETQPSKSLQQYASNVIKHSKNVIDHLLDLLFTGFEYTNVQALHELNFKRLDELQRSQENFDINKENESPKQQKRKHK